jgi:pimeloyl-ACP methyl ester carboxylesterase
MTWARSAVLTAVAVCSLVAVNVEAQEAPAVNGRVIRVAGHALYFEEAGRGDPVIMLHGFGGTATFWRENADSLALRYRVIVVDLPGHGRSDAMDSTIVYRNEDAARLIMGLMDSLRIQRAAFVGYSQGGMIALYIGVLAPARVTAIATVGAQAFYSTELRAYIERSGPDSAKESVMTRYRERHGPIRAMQLARQFWHFRLLDGDPSLTPDRLARIQARVLVVHGDDDFVPVSQAWYLYTGLRDAHLWVIPHAGHFPFTGSAGRAELSRRLVAFLAGEWKDS